MGRHSGSFVFGDAEGSTGSDRCGASTWDDGESVGQPLMLTGRVALPSSCSPPTPLFPPSLLSSFPPFFSSASNTEITLVRSSVGTDGKRLEEIQDEQYSQALPAHGRVWRGSE